MPKTRALRTARARSPVPMRVPTKHGYEHPREDRHVARDKRPGLFHIDPKKIAVMGGSAGGYLTLTSGFRVKPRPAALVSFWGYGDIAGAWYSRPDPFYSKLPAVPKEEAYAAVGREVIS